VRIRCLLLAAAMLLGMVGCHRLESSRSDWKQPVVKRQRTIRCGEISKQGSWFDFDLENQTESAWSSMDIKTDCGCLVVEASPGLAPDGASFAGRATFDLGRARPGHVARQIQLTAYPSKVLYIVPVEAWWCSSSGVNSIGPAA